MNKTWLKILLSLLGTVVLGAIGSGMWERFFGPLFDSATPIVINGMSALVSSYKDSIYKEVAQGFHEGSSVVVHGFVLMILAIAYIELCRKHPYAKGNKEGPGLVKSIIHTPKGYYILLLITLMVLGWVLFSTYRVNYINSAVTFSTQSRAILAPILSEKERLILDSKFFSIQSSADFVAFYNELVEISKKSKVQLPNFKPL